MLGLLETEKGSKRGDGELREEKKITKFQIIFNTFFVLFFSSGSM